MKLPAFVSRLFQTKSAVAPLALNAGWPATLIRESYAGAWQSHVVAVDSTRDVLGFSAVYACVVRISSDIAKLRPMMVVENDDGTCTEKPSPLASVLSNPNNFQNRIQFLQSWNISKLVWGNFYGLKGRDERGVVRRIYPLDPSRVKPLVTDYGDVYYELAADNLAGVLQAITVPAREIIHDRYCPLWHPLVGVAPIYAAALSATMGNRIQRNSTFFFDNMSRPGGVLSAPGKIEPDYAAELKRQWESSYGGVNAGRTAVLGNGLKFDPLASTPADQAQLVEQLKWSVEDVARCYGMPSYKIGGALPANTTVEALNQQYYDECLHVLIEDIELSLKDGLELPTDYFVELDLDGLLRMDMGALVKAEAEAVKAGIKAPNEARRKLNLPPVVGGDLPYLQQQNYSLEALAKRDAEDDPFGTKKTSSSPPANEEAYAAAFSEIFIKGLRASAA